MKEELFRKLVEYLENLEVVVREQIPDVLNQLLIKGIIIDSVVIATSVLSFVNLIVAIVLYKKFANYSNEPLYDAYLAISAVFTVCGIIAIVVCAIDLSTIIFTPKAYLLGMLK